MARPNSVTAKFKVSNVRGSGDDQKMIDFQPDYNDGRNKEWSKYTPAGSISLTVKGEVAEHFPLGQAFTVRFTPEDS